MLIHKIDVQDDYMSPIYEAEQYLIDTCKEYSIDYSDCTLMNVHPINEGLLSSIVQFIKAIFRKAIQLLVKIWKAIVGFVKMVIQKITGFFKRLFGKTDNSKAIEVESVITVAPGKAEKCKFKSVKDMENVHKQALQKFSSEIAKLEKQNIGYTKQLEKHSLKAVQESSEYVEEKVLYKDTKVPLSMTNKTSISDKVKIHVNSQNSENDDNFINDEFSSARSKYEDDTVMGSNDELSWINNNYIDAFPRRQAKLYLGNVDDANNIDERIEAINKMYSRIKTASLDRLIVYGERLSLAEDDVEDSMLTNYMQKLYDTAQTCYEVLDADVVDHALIDNIYPSFDHIADQQKRADAIERWVRLRINWNQTIIVALQKMIKLNGAKLRMDASLIESLTTPYGIDGSDLKAVRKIIQSNLHKMISDDGAIIDGRKIGLRGVFIQSDKRVDKWYTGYTAYQTDYDFGASWVLNNPAKFDSLIVMLTKYDITVLSHGKSEDGQWVMQKTILPNGTYCSTDDGNITYVNDYVKALIKLGFKRINLMVCNPGHHKLDPEIIMSKKVLVHMATDNVLRAF